MRRIIIIALSLIGMINVEAQEIRIKLWPNGAPNKNEAPGIEELKVENGTPKYFNVTEAELFVYRPIEATNTGAAVIICPGGGYRIESIAHEGTEIAEYLQSIGVTGIVLKYRLPYGNHEIPITDGLQAVRYVRSKADDWKLDPNKIGIAGASAGGHLASTVGTHYDLGDAATSAPLSQISSRPDFMILLYPVINLSDKYGHIGSRKNLIGEANDAELIKQYSNELWVNDKTPPTFLILCDDDKGVSPMNSIEFYTALKKHQVPAEMHIFQKGGHGFGTKKQNLPIDNWPQLVKEWMQSMKIIL